jgi:hypothetical protein
MLTVNQWLLSAKKRTYALRAVCAQWISQEIITVLGDCAWFSQRVGFSGIWSAVA